MKIINIKSHQALLFLTGLCIIYNITSKPYIRMKTKKNKIIKLWDLKMRQ